MLSDKEIYELADAYLKGAELPADLDAAIVEQIQKLADEMKQHESEAAEGQREDIPQVEIKSEGEYAEANVLASEPTEA